MANAVASAAENSQALETACAHHTDGLINCMAHNAVCAFNTRSSVVTRCSEDYKLNDAWRAKAHLHNSYQNILWLGHTVWGDHDMFHSCDTFAGGIMARSKAISGGPVYLSDLPSEFRPEVVGPLCFADGRLLRPLAPAAPLPDSAFVDPFVGGEAYRAVAPLPNAAAALACYNLTEPTVPVDVRVTGEEYAHAGAMLQGPDAGAWERPAEGLVIYDVKRSVALAPGEAFEATLAEFDDELLLLLPVLAGWAVVGRCDKYLPPGGVEVIDAAGGELIVRMLETGPLAVWSVGGEVSCDTGEAIREQGAAPQSGPSLWRVDLPVGEADVVVRLRRR
jgi:hypothetical protein